MKLIHEMVVLVEPDCVACVRVLETAKALRQRGIVANLVVLNWLHDPDTCEKFGVVIFFPQFLSMDVSHSTVNSRWKMPFSLPNTQESNKKGFYQIRIAGKPFSDRQRYTVLSFVRYIRPPRQFSFWTRRKNDQALCRLYTESITYSSHSRSRELYPYYIVTVIKHILKYFREKK